MSLEPIGGPVLVGLIKTIASKRVSFKRVSNRGFSIVKCRLHIDSAFWYLIDQNIFFHLIRDIKLQLFELIFRFSNLLLAFIDELLDDLVLLG